MPASDPAPPYPPIGESSPSASEQALRTELIGALDHDLRTSLTTVLGALQTLTRPGLAPADPDLAQLLSSAVTQARRMGRLLDELPAAASSAGRRHLSSTDLARLVREAAQAGEVVDLRVEFVPGFPGIRLAAAGLRRLLTGIFARAGSGWAGQVVVVADDADCRITITWKSGQNLIAPGFVVPLLAAMGGRLEAAVPPGAPTLGLVFSGAVGGPD